MKNASPGLDLEAFLRDFCPGLRPRAVLTRIQAGALPIELSPDGRIPAEPRILTCLAVVLPLLSRRARGLACRALWDRSYRALLEAELQFMKAYLVADAATGLSRCFLTPDKAAPVPEPGTVVIPLSALEEKWRSALSRPLEDLNPAERAELVPA